MRAAEWWITRSRRARAARRVRPVLSWLIAAACLVAGLAAQEQAGSATPAQSHAAGEKREAAVEFRWRDHPSIDFGRGTRLDFRARFQGDIRASDALLDAAEDHAGLDIARRRIGVAGEIRNLVDFQVEAELGADEPWRDVYANLRAYDTVQLQAGQFKLPFSLDENTSATNLDFVYRALAASQLSPGRDIGVMVHGRVVGRLIAYEAGVFRHDGRNARVVQSERVHGGRTWAGRVTVQPFRRARSSLGDLQVGAAFTTSELQEGFPDIRGRTSLDLRFFRPDVWVRGTRLRHGLEARWRPGPFGLKAEYMRVSDERLGQSVEDTDLSPLVSSGWYVSGTWAVTGEGKSAGLDRPRRPLFQAGYGAIELATRFERLQFGSGGTDDAPSFGPRAEMILGNSDRVGTLGVNWYVNRWAKVQFNVMHDSLRDPAQGPLPSRSGFWSRVLRFQLTI